MKIGLVIYPSIDPVITSLKHIPQIWSEVYYRAILYDVVGVVHNLDEQIIKIVLTLYRDK